MLMHSGGEVEIIILVNDPKLEKPCALHACTQSFQKLKLKCFKNFLPSITFPLSTVHHYYFFFICWYCAMEANAK